MRLVSLSLSAFSGETSEPGGTSLCSALPSCLEAASTAWYRALAPANGEAGSRTSTFGSQS